MLNTHRLFTHSWDRACYTSTPRILANSPETRPCLIRIRFEPWDDPGAHRSCAVEAQHTCALLTATVREKNLGKVKSIKAGGKLMSKKPDLKKGHEKDAKATHKASCNANTVTHSTRARRTWLSGNPGLGRRSTQPPTWWGNYWVKIYSLFDEDQAKQREPLCFSVGWS